MAIVGLDPTSGPIGGDGSRKLAPRPVSLSGQVVGLVANGLGQGEAMLSALYDELAALDALEGVIRVRKGSVSIPPFPEDWQRLTEGATVAITGFGG
ncbi:MAG TPA: hypothetical protein VGQ20_07980 [Acidimicrobiales bacterium]|jgi:hypothetical protein|nr:hypothetical protein [Acidimicrobiales bacterium]